MPSDFRRILVLHHDRPNENAGLWSAVELAKRHGAELTILEVLPELPEDAAGTVVGVDVREAILHRRREQLIWRFRPLEDEGVSVDCRVRCGKPFVEVIREVTLGSHDLVVKTARGHRGVSDRLFGSTALHLMRKCPCPVWVVKPGFPAAHRRILAAIDPVDGDPGLNRRILQYATLLASQHGAEAHVVTSWQLPDGLWSGALPEAYVEGLLETTHARREEALRDLLAHHDDGMVDHHLHLEAGAADQAILGKARELDVDLIVMGSVNQADTPGLFIGTTAEEVLPEARCSVLVLKPDHFVTPVATPPQSEPTAA